MSMDARWKVYVQDRRFDDNQISNMYLKLKWETVGRFSFDFRPMDGDESYMVANNTLRIFWGDLHKLDGVIQRVDWDSTQWCYHIYGADIRGLLLERVNATPATVHSYTSDIQTSVMFEGCDFPTNVWTGSGDAIGKYTFKYRVGIQNTIRTVGGGNITASVDSDRGIITAFGSDYLEDSNKSWEVNRWSGGACRIINGRYKNSSFGVISNTPTRVNRTGAWTVFTDVFDVTTIPDPTPLDYDSGTLTGVIESPYYPTFTYGLTDTSPSGHQICPSGYDGQVKKVLWFLDPVANYPSAMTWVDYIVTMPGTYKYLSGNFGLSISDIQDGCFMVFVNGTKILHLTETEFGVPPGGVGRCAIVNNYFGKSITNPTIHILRRCDQSYYGYFELLLCDVVLHNEPALGVLPELQLGTVFEVTGKGFNVTTAELPTAPVATLERDNHIIQYNTTDDQSDHVTSMTVRGTA